MKIFAIAGVFAFVIPCTQPESPRAVFPSILHGKDPSLVAWVRKSIEAANREPEKSESWLELGYIYEANSLDSLAVVTYDLAIAVNPTNARAWYRIFVVSHRQRDQERADEANSRLLELAPDYAPLHIRSGYWHLDLGRSSEAGLSFQRAVELDSGNPGGHWGLARIMMLENEPDKGERASRELAATATGRSVFLPVVGNCLPSSGSLARSPKSSGEQGERGKGLAGSMA